MSEERPRNCGAEKLHNCALALTQLNNASAMTSRPDTACTCAFYFICYSLTIIVIADYDDAYICATGGRKALSVQKKTCKT
eukprot:scaffold20571_cov111-Isochrysis_galbana.AAC.4